MKSPSVSLRSPFPTDGSRQRLSNAKRQLAPEYVGFTELFLVCLGVLLLVITEAYYGLVARAKATWLPQACYYPIVQDICDQ